MSDEGIDFTLSFQEQHPHVIGKLLKPYVPSQCMLIAQEQKRYTALSTPEDRRFIRVCIKDIIQNKRRTSFRKRGKSQTRGPGRPTNPGSIEKRIKKARRVF